MSRYRRAAETVPEVPDERVLRCPSESTPDGRRARPASRGWPAPPRATGPGGVPPGDSGAVRSVRSNHSTVCNPMPGMFRQTASWLRLVGD
ncbi:hypothetical protein FHR84_002391 [Actinopolyspora biskrensis]|uniref:Uncharacterized protein n=1 Tax=Actinopolyspora biskrensis TaxID=1470178 RepID=A0A852Z959_9ACTN|nr:hypothetical protein [Actinopolyspora biskrensis]